MEVLLVGEIDDEKNFLCLDCMLLCRCPRYVPTFVRYKDMQRGYK